MFVRKTTPNISQVDGLLANFGCVCGSVGLHLCHTETTAMRNRRVSDAPFLLWERTSPKATAIYVCVYICLDHEVDGSRSLTGEKISDSVSTYSCALPELY